MYSFLFAETWLREHGNLLLSADIAFNICIGNSDSQALLINRDTSRADLNTLLAASEDYMLGKDEARHIIAEVQDKMKDWRSYTKQLHIPNAEVQLFERRFDTMSSTALIN